MWEKIKFVTSSVWDFIKPTVIFLLTAAGKAAMKSAAIAVRAAAERSDLGGKEKAALAFDLIKTDLTTQGIDLLDRHINKAVELAYERLCADEA